ncbi:MAG: dihydropyrimidinase [Halanaerobiales bacterium]
MSKLIKNGTIITAERTFSADILIENEKIKAIGQNFENSNTEIIDASGKYILPGAVDAHVHLEMPFGGSISADSYQSGTKAAACGGVTSLFDFVVQSEGQDLMTALKVKEKSCQPQACIDYGFHLGITDLKEGILEEMSTLVDYGIPSFKVFTAYDFRVKDGELAELLTRAKEIGALISVHAENASLVESRTKKYLDEDKTSAWYHYKSRPEFVETEAVKRVTHIAKSLDTPIYIVHLASKEGLEEITRLRDKGYEIYAETCPQYLNFTKEVYKRKDGRNFVCSPPMKGQESQDALWEGIKRGDISVVATDHCPFKEEEKDWGKDDFTKIPNGCMGIENLYPYMLSQANQGKISFNKVVELCATNPAKIYGCGEQKGTISPGTDADIVIYDPEKEFTITSEKMHSNLDYTIWEDFELKGYPIMTFSRGKLVYKNEEFLGEPGWGNFIERSIEV